LICGWCIKICFRSADQISAEWLILVQMVEQMEIDMETNMAVNMGDKSVYMWAIWPQEDQSIKSKEASIVTSGKL